MRFCIANGEGLYSPLALLAPVNFCHGFPKNREQPRDSPGSSWTPSTVLLGYFSFSQIFGNKIEVYHDTVGTINTIMSYPPFPNRYYEMTPEQQNIISVLINLLASHPDHPEITQGLLELVVALRDVLRHDLRT